ncbi:MAG: SH3 domain-containing protein [Acidovorax sp.]|uniref:SH3 domain-containing protein n=1 Tax=Acidovorax sp. TaxID=1872122 RepID=UPI002623E675|nr:SH3 domain-containing protein [Acidovorax sp.]MDH4463867.1 SH3 domain-containing protein [Acidovorax sp.]
MKWLERSGTAVSMVLIVWGFLASSAQAQDTAVLKRATQLRDAPSDSGASVAPLEVNSVVTRSNQRKGPWTKVQTQQGISGWVHMFDLGPQAGGAAAPSGAGGNAAAGGLRSLGGLFGGSSGSQTTATSTIGLRGLGAEDIANAQPNPAAVGQAENLRVSGDQARQFAASAALQPRQIAPLAEPPRPTDGSRSGATGSTANPSDPNFSPN